MTSESVPATVVDAARESERISPSRLMRLKKFGAYISLATIVGGASGVQTAETVQAIQHTGYAIEAEFQRFSGMNAGDNAPLVVQPPICDNEVNINEGMDNPLIVQKNLEIEAQQADNKSSAYLWPETRQTTGEQTFFDRVENRIGELADRLEMTYMQLNGAIDTLHEAMHANTAFISEATGMEVVFSGTSDFTVDQRNFDAMQSHLFDPNNYEHSQQRQLIACVHQKLMVEKIKAGERMHIIVGAPGTVISNYKIMDKSKTEGKRHSGVALPIKILPLPDFLEAEVLVMVTPGSGDELRLNSHLGHELYHAGMHLIDLPIRLDPDERQADIAQGEIIEPWLNESRKTLSYQ